MDWYSANSGTPLIEIHLSAAQFAEMITTMNVSDGVPCTIRYFDGKSVEDPPDEETEAEKVRTGFKEKTGALARRLGEFRAEMGRLFEKKAVGKGDREEVLKQVDLFIQEVRSNMPFVLDQFEEATEKVVTTAKAEVEAFTMHAVTSAGLLAIADGTALKALPEGLPRSPDGTINNCALANGDEESNCQMCGGECPDRHRFASEETCRLAREVKG
jgi:hypothetical protein